MNFCQRLYQERTRSSEEEELDTWSPARVRPSVALQMKTLNNLVTGCKSHRGATLIDTYRCVPRHRTDRRVGVETRRRDNILACSSFMTRGYEPGRAITPRISLPRRTNPSPRPPMRSLHLRESSATLFSCNPSAIASRPNLLLLLSLARSCNSTLSRYSPLSRARVRANAIEIYLCIYYLKLHRHAIINVTAKSPRSIMYTERPIKEDNKSFEKDMSKHDSGTVSRPIIHWPIGETSIGVAR
ncbi:hypothetical protein WN51_00412 [Melipona quadrifasciata]|uniref:Uncharacterized protein n=1 Tax=Melipona quadrifasciata TaxID=166423 RepID=A0A0M9A2E3_9HYME|nr:hypothetical protein WN51_00412 [Melipona quadrifasciata]